MLYCPGRRRLRSEGVNCSSHSEEEGRSRRRSCTRRCVGAAARQRGQGQERIVLYCTGLQFIRDSAQRSAFPWQISQSEGFCERDGESWRWAAYRAEQSPQAFDHTPSPLPPPARRGVKSSAGLQIRRIFSFPTHHPITFCFVFEKTLARPDWCGHQPAPVLEDDRAAVESKELDDKMPYLCHAASSISFLCYGV